MSENLGGDGNHEANNDGANGPFTRRESQRTAIGADQEESRERGSESRASRQDQGEERTAGWARDHQGLLVIAAFISLVISAGSMTIAFLSYRSAAASSADSSRSADAAQSSAKAAVRQADAAASQVDISRQALEIQRQGVDAMRSEAQGFQDSDRRAGRTLSINIFTNGNVNYLNSGIHPVLIESARAAGGDTARQAAYKLSVKRGALSENWRPLNPGFGFNLEPQGHYVVALAVYRDNANRRHHSYACADVSGLRTVACPAREDD